MNPTADRRSTSLVLEKLRGITNNYVGVIELADDLDIETVTEIFIRVNSAGTELSQADFAMSKIAVNEAYGGNLLRKAIDYFCHLAVAPEFLPQIEKNEPLAKLPSKVERSWRTLIVSNVSAWIRRRGVLGASPRPEFSDHEAPLAC